MQLSSCVEPFGEVDVEKGPGGKLQVRAYFLVVPPVEGALAGIALDASNSMMQTYGARTGPFVIPGMVNYVEPVARGMGVFLAEKFSATGKVSMIYWAVGPGGAGIEEIGEYDAAELPKVKIEGPKKTRWGTGTKLLPPLQHFCEKFKDRPIRTMELPGAMCVFVTDGVVEDLDAVKTFCCDYAKEMAAGKRPFIKLFLLGVGKEVDEGQMEDLDDMFEGSGMVNHLGEEIDIWDHQLASDMTHLESIFKELVSETSLVVFGAGRILNQKGAVCRELPDGIPGLLRFEMPAGSTAFTLEFPGGSVTQDLSEALAKP